MKLLNLNDCGIRAPTLKLQRQRAEAKAEAEEGKRVIRLISTKNRNGKDPLKCEVYN